MRLIDIVNNMETREIACGGPGVDRAIGADDSGKREPKKLKPVKGDSEDEEENVDDEEADFDPNTTNEGSTVEKWHNQ